MKYKQIKKLLLVTAFFSAIGLVANKNTHSQGFNIEVSPGKSNLTINPGDTYIQTFRVGNYSGAKKNLFVYVQDFTVVNAEGTPTFFPNDTLDSEARRFALSQWVKLPYESIELENNQVMEIDAQITVPADAEAGGHYGAFFVQTESPEQQGTAIGSVGRIASLILVNVPGDVSEKILITKAYTNKGVFYEDSPKIEFVTFLKNEGNVHGIPVGAFQVSGGFGSKTKSVIYNQNQGAVLPGAPERRISEQFTLSKGDGFIPPIGKFTIELVARYGSENFPLETTIFFWLLPAKFIATVTLVILLGAFIVWRAIVSFKK